MRSTSILLRVLLGVAGNSAILLAQAQGAFAPTGDMTAERQGHTATLLTTGRVLVAGGSAILVGWPVWNSAELYDPVSGTFALSGTMTTPRADHTATLLRDGTFLIACAFGSSVSVMPGAALAMSALSERSTARFSSC